MSFNINLLRFKLIERCLWWTCPKQSEVSYYL